VAVAGAVALIPERVEIGAAVAPLGVAMAIVVVAVVMLAGSIWIAIRMEAGLDRSATPAEDAEDPVPGLRSCELRCARMTVGHAYPVRPVRCQLRPDAPNHGAARPARRTDSAVIHGVPRPREPVAYPGRARA
jgi:hypothetical protein